MKDAPGQRLTAALGLNGSVRRCGEELCPKSFRLVLVTHKLTFERQGHHAGSLRQPFKCGGCRATHREYIVDNRFAILENPPMRDLLVTKCIDRLPAVVTTTFCPQLDGFIQDRAIPLLFDFGSHRRVFEQIESILSMPVAGAAGVRVGSGDNHYKA